MGITQWELVPQLYNVVLNAAGRSIFQDIYLAHTLSTVEANQIVIFFISECILCDKQLGQIIEEYFALYQY